MLFEKNMRSRFKKQNPLNKYAREKNMRGKNMQEI